MPQKEGASQSDLCFKSTDTHQFLHFKSCHRYVYKKSIPYGQAIRMKRIFTNEEKLSSRIEDFEHWFCSRGYKKQIVDSEIQKVHSMNREKLLKKREKQDKNDSLTLVLTYHPALNNVHEILKKKHRHRPKTPSHVAFRNPKTLKDHYVRSKLKIRDSNDEENGIYLNVVRSTVIYVMFISEQ